MCLQRQNDFLNFKVHRLNSFVCIVALITENYVWDILLVYDIKYATGLIMLCSMMVLFIAHSDLCDFLPIFVVALTGTIVCLPQCKCIITHWGRDKMAAIFADDIFKYIFLNESVWISLKISFKFVFKVRINNIPALLQIMAWCRIYNHTKKQYSFGELAKCSVTTPRYIPVYVSRHLVISIHWLCWLT